MGFVEKGLVADLPLLKWGGLSCESEECCRAAAEKERKINKGRVRIGN